MTIFTSYYSNIKNIPPDYFLVSTSGAISVEIEAAVDSWNKSLAPSKSIYFEYKENSDWSKYVSRFKTEILSKVDWLEKLEQWEEKANKIGKNLDNIVLLCYEAADSGDGLGQFCHRHILAESIENEFKIIVKEYGYQQYVRSNYKLIMVNNAGILF